MSECKEHNWFHPTDGCPTCLSIATEKILKQYDAVFRDLAEMEEKETPGGKKE